MNFCLSLTSAICEDAGDSPSRQGSGSIFIYEKKKRCVSERTKVVVAPRHQHFLGRSQKAQVPAEDMLVGQVLHAVLGGRRRTPEVHVLETSEMVGTGKSSGDVRPTRLTGTAL